MSDTPVLVAGATGYVGGRLVPLLLERGYKVRALTRDERKVSTRPWGRHDNLEIIQGDMLDTTSVRRALEGCRAVYYLVHSMEAKYEDFSDADRRAAISMVRALKGRHDCRVIYLSGLIPDDPKLSLHLRSRREVGEILSLADAPVTTLQAAQLIGAGSASFEMIRYLVDRLPLMITPKWTQVKTQPIAASDALNYLLGVLEKPETAGETYDIGGPDIVSYADLFRIYAEAAGLKPRLIIPLKSWTSLSLSAQWVSMVTPLPPALSKPLIEGMKNEVICKDTRIKSIVPMEPTPIRTAVARALGNTRGHRVKSIWFDAGQAVAPEWVIRGDPEYAGAAVRNDAYVVQLAATPEEVWRPIVQIGGENGWYSDNFLWKLRGLMDKIVGGPGIHRGRRSTEELYVGDGLDFWRVLDIRPQRRLLLLTEMRLPGEGLLDVRVIPEKSAQEEGGPITKLAIALYFRPRGLPGLAYWYLVAPFHRLVFTRMLKKIAGSIMHKPILSGPYRVLYPYKPKDDDA